MTTPILLRQDAGHIATLTLNTPQTLNALSVAMIDAVQAELTALASDDTVRVVILRAAGGVFCAGHDLKDIQTARTAPDQGHGYFTDLFARCAVMMQSLVALPQPVIAAVQGIATAGGCQLAASCDMIVAADTARFGVTGVNIGLFCATPMVALTRKVAPAVAFEMLSTGAFLSAGRAAEVGLVNRVCAPDALDHEAMALATTLALKLPAALRIGKAAFYAQAGLTLADAYAVANQAMIENLANPATAEGIDAFLQKRAPVWD